MCEKQSTPNLYLITEVTIREIGIISNILIVSKHSTNKCIRDWSKAKACGLCKRDQSGGGQNLKSSVRRESAIPQQILNTSNREIIVRWKQTQ